MELELARWLVSPAAAPALAAAAAEADPDSLGAGERLRRRFPADQAAAALTQARLRRKAVVKFGDRAAELFFTPDGLEQATRGEVARWRAERYRSAGATVVVDLGCGLGADALAFQDAGMAVVAVEADPLTAVLATANLGVEVICGDAVEVAESLLVDGAAVFIDPARRSAGRRTWRVADFSPPWDFAVGVLAGRTGCVKAAPGLPSALIPDQLAATWVSHRGNMVETSLWSGSGEPGSRTAVLLPEGKEMAAGHRREPPAGPIGRYVYEPDAAVIRSGAVAALAEVIQGWALSPGIAYLSAQENRATAFGTTFEVLEVLPYSERALRAWVRAHDIGTLEIKTRGVEVDPAALRRRLKPVGSVAATVVISPTADGVRVLSCRRC